MSHGDEKFRRLLEAAPDAMVIVDRTGRMLLINSQTESMFGYSREELLNQPVEMVDRNEMLGRPDEFGRALAPLAGANGWAPTFMFRLGRAKREALRSPRRPLEDVVVPGARGG